MGRFCSSNHFLEQPLYALWNTAIILCKDSLMPGWHCRWVQNMQIYSGILNRICCLTNQTLLGNLMINTKNVNIRDAYRSTHLDNGSDWIRWQYVVYGQPCSLCCRREMYLSHAYTFTNERASERGSLNDQKRGKKTTHPAWYRKLCCQVNGSLRVVVWNTAGWCTL